MTFLEHFASETSPSRMLMARLWRRYALRELSASDNHAGLQRLYALPDPWDMRSEREQSRFMQTNALIEELTGPVGSILEIGCIRVPTSDRFALDWTALMSASALC